MSEKQVSSRSGNKADYDVVVIGTGMGGCAAGGISALRGLKTLILEKNAKPGGNCSFYEKDGFRVDTGTHLFIRGNKGPFGDLTKRLGMGTPIKFVNTKNTVHLMGIGADIIIPRSPVEFILKMVAPRLVWQIKLNPIHYPSIAKLGIDILTMKPEKIEELDNVSVEDFINRYTKSPEIQSMLGMLLGLCFILPPWEASAGESIWNLQKLALEYNLGYPKGGASIIPITFLQGAKQHGAEIRMKSGVQKIEVQDGKVASVILDDGQRVTTKIVISTSTIQDTVYKLTGEQFFTEEYVNMVNGIKPSWTAVQAKIGLKKKLVKAGSVVGGTPLTMKEKLTNDTVKKLIGQMENGEILDMLPIYMPVPSNYDPELAPKGCQLLTAVAVAPTLDIELKDSENVWIEGLMNSLREMIPKLDDNIIFCDTWSVKTLASWIGKSNGSAITTAQTINQVGHLRPPHETPVKGLYIAGDCGGPARGVGTELACQSGMDCGDLVASHIYNGVIK